MIPPADDEDAPGIADVGAAGKDAIRPAAPMLMGAVMGIVVVDSYGRNLIPDVGEAVVGGLEGNEGPSTSGD